MTATPFATWRRNEAHRRTFPPKKARTGSFAFSAWVYKQRNLIARYFNKLKQFRGFAARYDRDPLNFLAAISSLPCASG
jgi:transposase